ncbi:C40 family peptidase [Neobacillus vireti]|uniref:Cell wall endopeptidase n=1 Tax=Neobacillus vireti LMG 21834 TaxID=1131730 RepID=A0AB94IJ68_9BACI|nr:C40 family peptidase [Neobacillus vireti]ETI67109.1 cell wall endopeptidase [Neobacillus vireti LMG 21834]KLT19720.1 peptidase [Neobacillus vireti]
MDKWLVNVPVATIWTSFDSAREIDWDAVTNPIDIKSWLSGLTYETRLGLCEDNLVQTQLLFGQEVLLVEEKEEWAHILIPDQPSSKNENGYPGWVPKCQLMKRHEDWNLENGSVAVVTRPKAILSKEGGNLELSFQTTLPLLKEEDSQVIVKTPDGIGALGWENIVVFESLAARYKGMGSDIVSAGEQFLGLPYLWGGMSSYGYDCSGFSYSMCKANGYVIPRDAHDQASAGKPVATTDIKPGDLLFFAYEEGKGSIHHVGIYYGDGKLLHAPNTGKTVEIIPLSGTIYERELCAARRYWNDTEA